MNRIKKRFDNLISSQKKGLITFVTAGDPSLEQTVNIMHSLVRGGSDLIELGVPFSDPIADGPTIQRSSERALNSGADLDSILKLVQQFRLDDSVTPVVLMGYLNPIENTGYDEFARNAKISGVDGVLVVDMPPEESGDLNKALKKNSVDQIFLVAPNSPKSRVKQLASMASGFIYFVSVKGVTGDKGIDTKEITETVGVTKNLLNLPVGLGFGIKNADDAYNASKISDAVVVGSSIVEIIENNSDSASLEQSIQNFTTELRDALVNRSSVDRGRKTP